MRYILNGYDLEQIFGIIIDKGIMQLLAFPERKDSVNHDFPDQNGIDIDLTAPRFKARSFTFDCTMYGEDFEDVKNKNYALFNILRIQGAYQLYNDFLNQTFYIYYIKQTPKSTGIYAASKGGVAIDFQLVFGETDPFGNIPTVLLVDDLNRFLVP